MAELFWASFEVPNLIYSLMLILCMIFWLLTILGAFEIDGLDFDLDGVADGALNGVVRSLEVFNFGRLPVSIWLSFFSVFAWLLSVNLNSFIDYLGLPLGEVARLAGLSVVILPVSALATKMATAPFKKAFCQLRQSGDESFVGKTVTVTSSQVDADFGLAAYEDGGAPAILHVRTTAEEVLQLGDHARVLRRHDSENTYLVTKSIKA